MSPLHRCHLRFPRTSGEAFKDASYATAIEIPTRPSLWRRVVRALIGWL